MNISPQSDYMMQNAVLREIGNPTTGATNPQITEPLLRWAATKSQDNANTAKFTQNLAQARKHFLTQMLNAREQLKTWEKQNNLATWITGATIPVQGVASYQQIKKADEAAAQTQQIIDSNKDLAAAYRK
jgi:hypothetical protein